VVTAGGSHDDQPYGRGLAEWLYWPTLFKRNGIRFWNTFLDKFSVPTAKGTYRPGTSEEDIHKLLAALHSIANDTGFVVPEGMAVELLHIATSGIEFEKMPRYMDEAIAKIILSQTMTTDDGSSRAQGQVHAGVKQELITSDADLLTDSFTEGPARWFTDLNFGADVAAPIVTRQVEEEDDTHKTAETDEVLERQGWQRTDESFRSIYGDGFQRKKPAPLHGAAKPGEPPARDARADETNVVPLRDRREASFAEAALPDRDIVDQAVEQIMADEGWRTGVMEPFAGPLIAELTRAGSAEEVQAILARAAELDDEGALVQSLERAGFAVRMAAAAGQDGTA
jgi:phage gp29-like protein